MKNKQFKQVFLMAAFCGATLASAVALADVVVVVGAKSPVGNLTAEQASKIFLGKTNSAPGGDKVEPVNQAEDAKPYEEFNRKVIGKSSAQVKMYWSNLVFSGKGKAPREVSGNAEVKKLVADNPGMIGYIDKSAVDASVKVVLTP